MQISGLDLKEIDARYGKEQVAIDADQTGENGIAVGEEHEI